MNLLAVQKAVNKKSAIPSEDVEALNSDSQVCAMLSDVTKC